MERGEDGRRREWTKTRERGEMGYQPFEEFPRYALEAKVYYTAVNWLGLA